MSLIDGKLRCDGWCGIGGATPAEVTHIDRKGYVYCTPCGAIRKQSQPCRKLRPAELVQLREGKPLARY